MNFLIIMFFSAAITYVILSPSIDFSYFLQLTITVVGLWYTQKKTLENTTKLIQANSIESEIIITNEKKLHICRNKPEVKIIGINRSNTPNQKEWIFEMNILKGPIYNFQCFKIKYSELIDLGKVKTFNDERIYLIDTKIIVDKKHFSRYSFEKGIVTCIIREDWDKVESGSESIYFVCYEDDYDEINYLIFRLDFLDTENQKIIRYSCIQNDNLLNKNLIKTLTKSGTDNFTVF